MVIYDKAELMEKLADATYSIKVALETIEACKVYIQHNLNDCLECEVRKNAED